MTLVFSWSILDFSLDHGQSGIGFSLVLILVLGLVWVLLRSLSLSWSGMSLVFSPGPDLDFDR